MRRVTYFHLYRVKFSPVLSAIHVMRVGACLGYRGLSSLECLRLSFFTVPPHPTLRFQGDQVGRRVALKSVPYNNTHIIILIMMLRSMHNNNTLFGLLALLALHTNPIVCLGAATDLCNANPDICELVTGCYPDKTSRDGSCNMNWWAYVPTGEYKCPTEGCPLYIWMHGTMEANVREPESYVMQLEMLKRGYIAVQAGYDDDMFGYMNSPGKLLLTLMYKFFSHEETI